MITGASRVEQIRENLAAGSSRPGWIRTVMKEIDGIFGVPAEDDETSRCSRLWRTRGGKMALGDLGGCLGRQTHVLGKKWVDSLDLLGHALRHEANGEMGIGRRAQFAERKGFTQIELSQHAAVKSIRNYILRDVWRQTGELLKAA